MDCGTTLVCNLFGHHCHLKRHAHWSWFIAYESRHHHSFAMVFFESASFESSWPIINTTNWPFPSPFQYISTMSTREDWRTRQTLHRLLQMKMMSLRLLETRIIYNVFTPSLVSTWYSVKNRNRPYTSVRFSMKEKDTNTAKRRDMTQWMLLTGEHKCMHSFLQMIWAQQTTFREQADLAGAK